MYIIIASVSYHSHNIDLLQGDKLKQDQINGKQLFIFIHIYLIMISIIMMLLSILTGLWEVGLEWIRWWFMTLSAQTVMEHCDFTWIGRSGSLGQTLGVRRWGHMWQDEDDVENFQSQARSSQDLGVVPLGVGRPRPTCHASPLQIPNKPPLGVHVPPQSNPHNVLCQFTSVPDLIR